MSSHLDYRCPPQAAQLVLDLRRKAKDLPIAQDSTALLQALADLLLGALGEQVEDLTNTVHGEGVADEPQDHT
jgi:hypothetical protein